MAYHHGNLRRALLDAALDLFVARGSFDFTLRELAREAGVTHNAPYRHFEGKADLLAAIRTEGFEALAEASRAALRVAGEDARARVRGLGAAYVGFALERPHHFRLMLHNPLGDAPTELDALAFAILKETIDQARTAGVVRDDMSGREIALAAWALVHGLASLVVSGHLPADPARVRRWTKTLDAIFFEGALAR